MLDNQPKKAEILKTQLSFIKVLKGLNINRNEKNKKSSQLCE